MEGWGLWSSIGVGRGFGGQQAGGGRWGTSFGVWEPLVSPWTLRCLLTHPVPQLGKTEAPQPRAVGTVPLTGAWGPEFLSQDSASAFTLLEFNTEKLRNLV